MESIKLIDFVDLVASDDPTRGGGSVSALSGSLGVSLLIMVTELMLAKADFELHHNELERIKQDLIQAKEAFIDYINKDSAAFNKVIEAYRLPRATDLEKALRREAIQAGFVSASLIPLEVCELVIDSAQDVEKLLSICPEAFVSDARVGTFMLDAAFKGARENVLINLDSIKNEDVVSDLQNRLDKASHLWENYNREFAYFLS